MTEAERIERAAILTTAQRRELERVRDTGTSRTKAGYYNRIHGRTEWLWKLEDGSIIGNSDVHPEAWYDQMQGSVLVGERLTSKGIALLSAPAEMEG